MAMSAPRARGRWSQTHSPDTPGFRRRHRLLALLLALHLPGLGALAVMTGGEAHDVLVEGAVVLLALALGALLDLSPRLRSLAITAGLLWSSAVVGLLTGTLVGGVLHAATVGLLAAAHVGASWRHPSQLGAPSAASDAPDDVPDRDDEHDDPSQEGLVEVQELYTGVWSAQRLVRPRTRLVRAPERAPDEAVPAPAEEPALAAAGHREPAERTDVAEDAERAEAGPEAAPITPEAAPAASRDPDLTREVLEALHLGAVEETPVREVREHVSTGPSSN